MKRLCVGVLSIGLLSVSVHAETEITVEVWGADPSSNGQVDWSAGSAAFTHARNIKGGDVDFTPADGYGLTGTLTFYGVADPASFSGPGGSGSLTGLGSSSTTSGADTIDGSDGAITRGFSAGANAILTLTGLQEYRNYELVLYQANYQNGKLNTLTFNNIGTGSSGNATKSGVDRGNVKISIAYATGTNTSVSLRIDAEPGAPFNWFAFSNESGVARGTLVLLR